MKQTYETPEVQIEVFETEDVLRVSIVKDRPGELDVIDWSTLNP